jgi:protein TonB
MSRCLHLQRAKVEINAHWMTRLYQKPNETRYAWTSVTIGLVVVLLIFLLVPLTQMFEPPSQDETVLEAIEVSVAPPPPPLPPLELSPPPEDPDPPPPELTTPPSMPTLEQMQLLLNPGTGGDLSLELGLDLNFQTESAEQLIDLFGFDELDQVPHVKRYGRFNYRSVLQRRGVGGYVELLIFIDTSGRVEVQEVLSYSHREFIAAAKAGAAATRFSPPVRNGQPVRAKYSWRIEFRMDR